MLARVLRTWYPTVCYELCVLNVMPALRITYGEQVNFGQSISYGYYDPQRHLSSVSALPYYPGVEREYIFTLAREARHLWQIRFNQPPTETDCDKFAEHFLQKFAAPVVPPYPFGIEGEPFECTCGCVSMQPVCDRCRAKERAAEARAKEERRREAELSRAVQQAAKFQAADAKRRERAAAKERQRVELIMDNRRRIDHHPDNGKSGWWCIDGRVWAFATSAGEAIINAAQLVDNDMPEVYYIGSNLPPQVEKAFRDRERKGRK